MNISQNLPTALPIYDKKEKQFFQHSYCTGFSNLVAVRMRYSRMIPWLILRDSETLPTVYLVRQDETDSADISAAISMYGFSYTDGAVTKHYVSCAGSTDISPSATVTTLHGSTTWGAWVCKGRFYYLKFVFGEETLYSELFQIEDFPEFSEVPDDDKLSSVRIECVNTCPVGDIPPVVSTSQKIFLPYPGRSVDAEYLYASEKQKYGNDEESVLWNKISKRFLLRFYACESVLDFIYTIPLYSTVNITDQFGVQSDVYDIEVKHSWDSEQNGCVALVELLFSRDFVQSTGCC